MPAESLSREEVGYRRSVQSLVVGCFVYAERDPASVKSLRELSQRMTFPDSITPFNAYDHLILYTPFNNSALYQLRSYASSSL